MDERKSFLVDLAETIDRHLPRRGNQQGVSRGRPGRLGRLLRWFLPNGGTLVLVALLVVTAQVWAKPLVSPAGAPGPSATTINYQGRLADSGGNPVPDGVYAIKFAIYDALSGGNLIWPLATGQETHTVEVADGLFSVPLGGLTSGGIPPSTWNGDRYLEITVGTETLSPRELIRSVPVAGMALAVPNGTIGSDQIVDGAVTPRKISLPSGQSGLSGDAMSIASSRQDIAGANATVVADTTLLVIAYATFDFETDASTTAIGELWVDGSKVGRQAIQNGGRGTIAQTYRFLVGPGSHTLQLRTYKAGSGSATVGYHTILTWFVIAQ